jgi:periplasmic protein CpxP/Spy
MLLNRKSVAMAIAVLAVGSTVAIANPQLHNKTLNSAFWDSSIAQMPRRNRVVNTEEGKGRFLEKLNLTSLQKQELSAIRQKYRGQIEPVQNDMQMVQQELFSMMAGDDPTESVRSKYQEATQLRQELSNLRFQSMLEMREVLTPQQRSQLAQMMEQRRRNWRDSVNDEPNKNWF